MARGEALKFFTSVLNVFICFLRFLLVFAMFLLCFAMFSWFFSGGILRRAAVPALPWFFVVFFSFS